MRVNEQGRSMIEMLGVLAIVGVLSVGGIAGYSKAMAKFKANKAIDQATMITTNIRTLYASQRSFKGLDNELAKNTNAIPAEMFTTTSDSLITNAFGGDVIVEKAFHMAEETGDEAKDRPDAYIVAFDSIPQSACVTMATTDWGGDAGSGFVYMAVVGDKNAREAVTAAEDGIGSDATATVNTGTLGDVQYAIPGAADDDTGSPMNVVIATSACSSKANNAFVWKYI